MVIFGPTEVDACMKLGREAAKKVTQKFIKPISLEFEKVYFPYLLISKKRYAGLFWTKPEKYDKMDAKGIESVRRDNCGLVRRAIDTSLRKILIDRDVPGAIAFAKAMIRDILQDKCDLSDLIITKQLKDSYKTPQAHSSLAERMRKRNPATAPHTGDRIPFVIIRGDKKSKLYERAEDPLYVLEHDIPVDTRYYIDNQLSKPLLRLFDALMDNPQSLLTGEHTRSISVATPTTQTNTKGTLLKFARVKETCLKCRAPLNADEKCLCGHCGKNAPAIYQTFQAKLRKSQMEYSRLWTQCQNCQGSVYQEVICTASDCPIYYLRFKVKKEVEREGRVVQQFRDLTW